MIHTSYSKLALMALIMGALLFAGCTKKTDEADSGKKTSEAAAPAQPEVAPIQEETVVVEEEPATPTVALPSSNSVYFAFNRADLDQASEAILAEHAAWLQDNPDARITVEGNCDSRGSREYNLALGQQRADSVRDALVQLGVDRNRIDTVSFGEERPVCTGTGTACWAQNRHADIVTH